MEGTDAGERELAIAPRSRTLTDYPTGPGFPPDADIMVGQRRATGRFRTGQMKHRR